MQQRTVVLIAMESEAAALRSRMTGVDERTQPGALVIRGELAGRPLTAVLTGIGKVAAATAATAVLATEQPNVLISAGVAGGVRPDVEHGSLLVVSGAVEHDYDLRPFVRDRAHDFRGPRTWLASADASGGLLRAAHLACWSDPDRQIVEAWTATGDHVVTDRERHGPILELGSSVACVDMETAAIAYVATAHDFAWAGLRVISDSADEHLDAEPVLTAALDAGALIADVLEHYLHAL